MKEGKLLGRVWSAERAGSRSNRDLLYLEIVDLDEHHSAGRRLDVIGGVPAPATAASPC
jgi:hypothetical protein